MRSIWSAREDIIASPRLLRISSMDRLCTSTSLFSHLTTHLIGVYNTSELLNHAEAHASYKLINIVRIPRYIWRKQRRLSFSGCASDRDCRDLGSLVCDQTTCTCRSSLCPHKTENGGVVVAVGALTVGARGKLVCKPRPRESGSRHVHRNYLYWARTSHSSHVLVISHFRSFCQNALLLR